MIDVRHYRRMKKLDEAKTTIKEKRLRSNDEGTQVSNISFTSTSDNLDTTAEEFVLLYGDQELGKNVKNAVRPRSKALAR